MKNESSQKKQKHIFIRVDKQIEPGDLVRCVEERGRHPIGQVRKVRDTDGSMFWLRGCDLLHDGEFWEVVHKLKVGDLVEIHKSGRPMKVTAVDPEFNRFRTPGMMLDWYATDEFSMYQKPKTESIGKAYGINKVESDAEISLEGALAQSINDMMAPIADGSRRLFAPKPDRKAEMQKAVAEMVVELLDQETTISLGAYSDIGLTMVEVLCCGQSLGEAELAPNDTWDTLTGLFVALSRATGRDLPDWIYGKEAAWIS